jgi:hypothetical protein
MAELMCHQHIRANVREQASCPSKMESHIRTPGQGGVLEPIAKVLDIVRTQTLHSRA